MQNVSSLYTTILSGSHVNEWKVQVNGVDYTGIKELRINRSVFSDSPKVGMCVSADINLVMIAPIVTIPRMAEIRPFVRVTNGTLTSEWLPKGVFRIDTRSQTKNDGVDLLTIHGYDDMLKAEQDCPIDSYPQTDFEAVQEIAEVLGVDLDDSVEDIMTNGYQIPIPAEYSCREVLGYIAAMYAGCFIVDDFGHLRLVTLNGMPPETNYLINNAGFAITFGGVRILV